jgi:hypothetical protein
VSSTYGNYAAPATEAEAVTISNGATFAACRALYVGVGGNLSVQMAGPSPGGQGTGTGAYVHFVGVPTGAVLPISVVEVRATSTTASSIMRLF